MAALKESVYVTKPTLKNFPLFRPYLPGFTPSFYTVPQSVWYLWEGCGEGVGWGDGGWGWGGGGGWGCLGVLWVHVFIWTYHDMSGNTSNAPHLRKTVINHEILVYSHFYSGFIENNNSRQTLIHGHVRGENIIFITLILSGQKMKFMRWVKNVSLNRGDLGSCEDIINDPSVKF